YQPRRYVDRHRYQSPDSWGEAAPDLSGKTLSLELYQPRRYVDRHRYQSPDSWGEAAPDLSGKTLSL
ncbi:hypothetical protein CK247_31705, partial [Klebsiella pneumoniae]